MTALEILLDDPIKTAKALGLDLDRHRSSPAAEWDNFNKHENWDNWRNR